jgi:hypothetical protein
MSSPNIPNIIQELPHGFKRELRKQKSRVNGDEGWRVFVVAPNGKRFRYSL